MQVASIHVQKRASRFAAKPIMVFLVLLVGGAKRTASYISIAPLILSTSPIQAPKHRVLLFSGKKAFTDSTTAGQSQPNDHDDLDHQIFRAGSENDSHIFEVGEHGGSKAQPGTVYFVATPIGNLGDITYRAAEILRTVDIVASEDTRRTGRLLQYLNAGKKRQISHHEHNWKGRVPQLIALAREEGRSIAVVSDAGTPGIADPGTPLARACAEAGVPAIPIPGPCAAAAALSVAGVYASEYVFFGFLPAKRGTARTAKLREVLEERRTSVFYEAPHRLEHTLREMVEISAAAAGRREIVCARELTKLHESFFRGTVQEAWAHFSAPGTAPRGEFTVVLGPREEEAPDGEAAAALATRRLRELMAEGVSTSRAVKAVVQEVKGLKKAEVYNLALELSGDGVSCTGNDKPGSSLPF